MTANKLHSTLKFIAELDTQLRLQAGLEAIRDTLNNLVASPAQPAQQSALASALGEFSKSAEKLTAAIAPSQATAIAEMGGQEFFDPLIAEKITVSVSANAMTPSVARDFVRDLATRRESFLQTVTNTIEGLEGLNVSQPPLPAGAADLAFLIPRGLFDNRLAELAKELSFISRLIQDIGEGLTGQPEPVKLESLSSSIPTITLEASLAAIATLAIIVNKFLEAWDRIQKIRKVRDELFEMGLRGAAVEELSEQVTTTVEEIVEESTQLVVVNYNGHDQARKNELETAVRTDVRRLFGQIERGLTIEFHAEPKKDAGENDKKALDTVVGLSHKMNFPPPANEPLLLGTKEVLEGEIRRKVIKKTSTQKNTTIKKESKKSVGAEADEEM
jgi:hypothetical protein